MRYLAAEIRRMVGEERKMALVSGPRQVGKTTLAKDLLGEAKARSAYFNWDVEQDRRDILHSPGDFWLRHDATGKGTVRLVLDEIHKFPRWKRFLKGLYDGHHSHLEIIVTGSGKLDTFQRGGDSLFGRYQLYHLHPFTVGEVMGITPATPDAFFERVSDPASVKGAEEALAAIERFTGFPEPLFAASETRFNRWRRAHEQLIIREDLRDLSRIREIGLIEALVTLLPDRIGSPLSVNALRELLDVRHETVHNWLKALARLYFAFTIRPYAGKLARTLRREEKVYLFDFTRVADPGRRFENLVALHLLKLCDFWNDLGHGDFSLHYVRDREKREVDFLITSEHKPFALIEAKHSAADVDPSLRYFKERLKPRHAVQVVRVPKRFSRPFRSEGILLTPAARFLAAI